MDVITKQFMRRWLRPRQGAAPSVSRGFRCKAPQRPRARIDRAQHRTLCRVAMAWRAPQHAQHGTACHTPHTSTGSISCGTARTAHTDTAAYTAAPRTTCMESIAHINRRCWGCGSRVLRQRPPACRSVLVSSLKQPLVITSPHVLHMCDYVCMCLSAYTGRPPAWRRSHARLARELSHAHAACRAGPGPGRDAAAADSGGAASPAIPRAGLDVPSRRPPSLAPPPCRGAPQRGIGRSSRTHSLPRAGRHRKEDKGMHTDDSSHPPPPHYSFHHAALPQY